MGKCFVCACMHTFEDHVFSAGGPADADGGGVQGDVALRCQAGTALARGAPVYHQIYRWRIQD